MAHVEAAGIEYALPDGDFNQACFDRILVDESDGELTIATTEETAFADIVLTATPDDMKQGAEKSAVPYSTYSTVEGSNVPSLVDRKLQVQVWVARSLVDTHTLTELFVSSAPTRPALSSRWHSGHWQTIAHAVPADVV